MTLHPTGYAQVTAFPDVSKISVAEKLAVISELAACKFVDDVINFFDAQNSDKRKRKK
ncbi:MAG: hypothetical protein IKD80_00040 [Selenomonadaceae bacterium]|nr:hypothetical protein [Selenomonadaceae bacterium]